MPPRNPAARRKRPRTPAPVTEARVWTFELPDYLPPSLNDLLGHWARRNRLKKECREFVGIYGFRVPKAAHKRTVTITLTRSGQQKERDADNIPKALLDALVQAGLLVDDSPAWCVCNPVVQVRGPVTATTITLEERP